MSSFISKAACRGHRPSAFAARIVYERPGLVARMLRERQVARFLVAPSGYGKTHVMADYAETVFNWAHVFWITGASPCFVRDLDAGALASSCFALDADAALVVFDDVPFLDPDRAKLFSAEIDSLLEGGCEVIVACSPADYVMGQLQPDQVRINAENLLLDDDELDSLHRANERTQLSGAHASTSQRIPALAWPRGKHAAREFLLSFFKRDVRGDVLVVAASMLVLQQGERGDLEMFGPAQIDAVFERLPQYPHLGFDEATGSFSALPFEVDDIAHSLKKHGDSLASSSPFDSIEELVLGWAKLLLDGRGDMNRACDVVRTMCPRSGRTGWMVSEARRIVKEGCFLAGVKLAASQRPKTTANSKGKSGDASIMLEAICRSALGDTRNAELLARPVAFKKRASEGARILALLVVARYGSQSSSSKAMHVLESCISAKPGGQAKEMRSFHLPLARAWCSAEEGPEALASTWEDLEREGACEDALLLASTWLFSQLESEYAQSRTTFSSEGSKSIDRIVAYVRRRLEGLSGAGENYFALAAGLAMERAHANGVVFRAGPLPANAQVLLRQAELSVASQRLLFGRWTESNGVEDADSEAPQRSRSERERARNLASAQRDVPVLTLKLFGSFEVAIDGVPVDTRLFNRQNTRNLLVLLAANQGRELSRANLYEEMWPNSAPDVARRNFYTVWSALSRALTLPDGSCPYLVRNQYGCSLDGRYVRSDLMRLKEICRELLFGRGGVQDWPALYDEIDQDFSAELMPTERFNELIIATREEYKVRLVDALIAATQTVMDEGNPQWGIWFARAAIDHERTREDAYLALMRAQVAADQRTAAIKTYHTCRKVLMEELGVDPSPEITELYKSIIDVL